MRSAPQKSSPSSTRVGTPKMPRSSAAATGTDYDPHLDTSGGAGVSVASSRVAQRQSAISMGARIAVSSPLSAMPRPAKVPAISLT